jgi:hypothetical protein
MQAEKKGAVPFLGIDCASRKKGRCPLFGVRPFDLFFYLFYDFMPILCLFIPWK